MTFVPPHDAHPASVAIADEHQRALLDQVNAGVSADEHAFAHQCAVLRLRTLIALQCNGVLAWESYPTEIEAADRFVDLAANLSPNLIARSAPPQELTGAMRRWATRRFGSWIDDHAAFPDEHVRQLIDDHYPTSGRPKFPGGLALFRRDHPA